MAAFAGPGQVLHCKIGAQASVDALGTMRHRSCGSQFKLWGLGGERSMQTVPGWEVGAHDPWW